METWDLVLLVVAGYIATSGLASLMIRRREQLTERFRAQMEQGKARRAAEPAPPPTPETRRAA